MKSTPTNLRIEDVPIDSIRPSPDNPRTMSAEQMTALERSISEFGLVDPILVREADSTVIGGHQRLDAAQRLGLKTVPVVFLDVSEEQSRLLNIALNKISGDWNLDQLGKALAELRDLPEVDVTLTGFGTEELEDLFAEFEADSTLPALTGDLDADAALAGLQENDKPSRVKRGQLWQLGEHLLLCGDTLADVTLDRLCQEPVPLVVTGAPYGIDYQSRMTRPENRKAPIANDEAATFESLLERALPLVRSAMQTGATLYWFCGGGGPTPSLGNALLAISRHFQLQDLLVWDKEAPGLGWRWRRSWEAVIDASVGDPAHWYGGTHRRSILRWPRQIPQADDHPTPKPPELLAELIRVSSRPKDSVLDPFAGSGSTLIAAQLTGRRCLAVELEPRYCDLILARWESVSGQRAVLAEG